MGNEARVIRSLQKEIDRVKNGVLLSIKLLNKDEMNILIDDTSKVVDKFYDIVYKACEKAPEHVIIKTPHLTKLYVIIPDMARIGEKLAYLIYSQVQLYVDSDCPESYLKCAVSSIKFFPERTSNVEKLLSLMGYGMYVSKDQSYYYCYDDNPVDIEDLRKRNCDLNLLRYSLFKKKAQFAYQPIVDRKSGHVEYYECLLRVLDENNNLISVGSMIKDAEIKGLIHIVDLTAMEMAISELDKDKDITLSVNVSNIGVLNQRFLRRIESLLKKYDVANRLIIEITETSLNQDFSITKKFIDTLRSCGCRFSLDDFGSGFTSFRQLLDLSIDIIKIDGSYIRSVLNDRHSESFVKALIKLASDLEIKTVAEFVENGKIAKFLIDMEIDSMQGNFFLPASATR